MRKPPLYLATFLLTTLNVSVVASAAGVPQPAACLLDGAAADGGNTLDAPPPGRVATLARGVNVTDLFGEGNKEALAPLFRHLRAAGIRHIRIPISSRVFAPDPPVWQSRVLTRLDRAVCAAIVARLGVVIDLHPFEALEPVGGTHDQIADRLSAVWRHLAARYAKASPDLVFFEVLNEPKFPDEREWEHLQSRIVLAIRSVAPRNTLILTASPWSTATSLIAMMPVADRNVVYTFHTYTPMIFTHQSAPWSLPSYASVAGLAFPANAENVRAVAGHIEAARQDELAAYGRDFVDDQRIASEIDVAASWGRRNGVAVVATEFGVLDKAPPSARAAWLSTVRLNFEARGIGWTVWEYRGGFGIASDLQRGCMTPDSAAKALDLCGQ